MKSAVLIQARMGSKRFPGKVLAEAGGKPVLGWLLERLARCTSKRPAIVLTSSEPSDDPIAAFCAKRGVLCRRGDLENVASRFKDAAERGGLDFFVRVTCDSPLLDPALVDEAVALFEAGRHDLVTNVHKRTFPRGQSVEAVRTSAFLAAVPRFREAGDREHVTTFFYKHARNFKICNFESPVGDFSGRSLCVDTPGDFERFAGVIERVRRSGRPLGDIGWRELLEAT